MIETLVARYDLHPGVAAPAAQALRHLCEPESATRAAVRLRVIEAFLEEGLAESDFAGTTGYGYDDAARTRYESLLARILRAERVLARLSIVSGTHAIVATLAACVRPGERLLSATGRPYDTLRNALVEAEGSLVSSGIAYEEVALRDGRVDREALRAALARTAPAAVFVQRSRGYAARRSLSIGDCADLIALVKREAPQALVLVDNCYCELVEDGEPLEAGADAVIGSLIKNLGGGIAPAGGYVAGSAAVIERTATRLYAPGLGTALGPTLGLGRLFFQGLFYAPLVIGETLRGLDFAAALFARLGFDVDPAPGEERSDIIQAIRLRKPELVLAFARGLQRAMPVNARFVPVPGRVPGYADPVIMSSGAFIAGATVELSCDAPLREPYDVFLQGGVVAQHALLGALFAASEVLKAQA